jgi:hypothetical protein
MEISFQQIVVISQYGTPSARHVRFVNAMIQPVLLVWGRLS